MPLIAPFVTCLAPRAHQVVCGVSRAICNADKDYRDTQAIHYPRAWDMGIEAATTLLRLSSRREAIDELLQALELRINSQEASTGFFRLASYQQRRDLVT